MKATANVVYYTSKTLANGEHPLMIRYCKDGKKKYKSLGICKIRDETTWSVFRSLSNTQNQSARSST